MLDVFVVLRKWLRKRLRNQAAATAVVALAVSGNCGEADAVAAFAMAAVVQQRWWRRPAAAWPHKAA